MATYRELLEQRDSLEQQIAEARRSEVAAAIVQAKQLIAEYGLTAADCGFRGLENADNRRRKVSRSNGEGWSGRGKAPNWLTSLRGARSASPGCGATPPLGEGVANRQAAPPRSRICAASEPDGV
jgi:DNA-binding protein H-NS